MGIVILAIVLLMAILLFILSKKPFVPNNYTKTVETGGKLEAKYPALHSGMDHGKMRYSADGYVTAWFLWYLQYSFN